MFIMSLSKKTSPELLIKSVIKNTHLGKAVGASITFLLREDSGEEREEQITISCTPAEFLGNKAFYRELENRGVIFYDTSRSYRASLLEQLQKAEVTKAEILCQGVNFLNKERMCLLGDTLILRDNFEAPEEYRQYKVARKVSVPFDFVLNFMQLSPVCPLLLAYVAVSVLEGYFATEPWNSARFVCVLEGQTGSYKSTLARMVTNFDFQQNTLTLGSTKASLETRLGEADNIPVLLDDFNLSSYGNSKKGTVLTEIIQAFTERHKLERRQGKTVAGTRMGGGILVTAEEMPKNHSTLNRCLLVKMDSSVQIDTEKLSILQEQSKCAMSELVIGFNQYILNNFEDVKEAHRAQIQSYRDKKEFFPYCDENVYGYSRIVNTYAVAKSAAGVLSQFFQKKFLSKELADDCRKLMQSSVYEACEKLCCRLSKDEKISNEVLSDFLYDLEFKSFTDSEEKYYRKQGKYTGILLNGILYIQGKCIDGLIKMNCREYTRHQIVQSLERFGLLIIDSDGRKSIHLPGGEEKTRYYAIRYYEMEDVVRKQKEKFNDCLYEWQRKMEAEGY